ncbi:MAG TPA: winged helix DNA-binding domain-containing protein [Candidatus Dormibacteraeota bacterium]|nr:winged helix DNA-binding domain-containing protein [Candidatus Dormibacteraeota bacterium]
MLRLVFGLQAQLLSAAGLGLRARSRGLVVDDISRALAQDRSIVRSWLFRGTLHVVAAEDLRWLVRLLGPVFARGSVSRQEQLGLTGDIKARGVNALRQILADAGPLTRDELVDRLFYQGIRLDPKSQAPIHLIRLAALQSILCLGPDRQDGKQTYVLLDDWLPASKTIKRETALAQLALRYFTAYGPATIDDLAAFSGLTLSEAREAALLARSELAEVTAAAKPAFIPRRTDTSLSGSRQVAARLLPAFDTYLLGYRRRELAVPAALRTRLQRGGGWLHAAMVVNGKAMAAWTLRRTGKLATVRIESIGPIRGTVLVGLKAEVADIARFLGVRTRLAVAAGSLATAEPPNDSA